MHQRFFVFSAVFSSGLFSSTRTTMDFGSIRLDFPTKKKLKDIVSEMEKAQDPIDIVILSICELSQDDYKTYWSED